MPEREAALARGFVLGQDDRIDAATREDFRRSGLAHLLAVSGQNVLLLCLLAWPFLALLGLTLRTRLLLLLALIAVYVPVTGAGPSIQRAAVMGAAGLLAALAERPSSRWYALLLAVGVTLALNPRAAGDVGWQLSFAAVAGILLWTGRLATLLAGDAARGSPRRAVAEGVAVTVAATRGDGAADGAPLRLPLAGGASRQPARAAGGGAGDVAGDAERDRRPAAGDPGGAAQLAQLALPRLHRPDRALARLARVGSGRVGAGKPGGGCRRIHGAAGPCRARVGGCG